MPPLRLPRDQRRLLRFAALLAAYTAAAAPAQPPDTRPATVELAVDARRVVELLALVEGPNSAPARLTGAKELLRLESPETAPRVVAMLRGPNVAAATAVAAALADLPQYLTPDYITPLTGLLDQPDAAAARAASAALAGYAQGQSIPALRGYIGDAARPLAGRLEAVRALGLIPLRESAAALVELLAARETVLRDAALAALERLAGVPFAGDLAAARNWWTQQQRLPTDEWRSLQIRRLSEQQRVLESTLATLEGRLTTALRDVYSQTPDAERPTLLTAYLADPVVSVRLLALELVQIDVAEGRPLSTDTLSAMRSMVADVAPAVRAVAIRTLAGLRGPTDGELFLTLLAVERDPDVRLALVNALGYVGSPDAAEPLMALLNPAETLLANAAVAALGRLAERGVLEAPARERLVTALLELLPQTSRNGAELRERTVWAMSRLADPRFADTFSSVLDPAEPPAVRQAAVRGLVVLGEPRHRAAVIQASRDKDAAVRQVAVEALGRLSADGAALTALWERLTPPAEADETVRDTAWAGVLRILQDRPVEEIETALTHLPGNGVIAARRAAELLQLMEQRLIAANSPRAALGRVRARLAAQHAAGGAAEAAVTAWLAAVDDLHAAGDPGQTEAVVSLLRYALTNGRYDEPLAAALAAVNPPLDGAAVWSGIREELECRLTAEHVDRTLPMLEMLQQHPPADFPDHARHELAELTNRARGLRAELDGAAVSSAISQLRADFADEFARSAVIQLGARAVPGVCDALLAAIEAEPADPEFERLLHNLLLDVLHDWTGYPTGAPQAERRAAVAAARRLGDGSRAQ
jgi:HEAT repeat protein